MTRLGHLREATKEMVDAVADLVALEDLDACADGLVALVTQTLGHAPERRTDGGNTHLLWSSGKTTTVLLLGHYDTVWPLGTVERWPFVVTDDRASGPGAFDMKAGIVQMLWALSTLDDLDGVTVLLTADEETGSFTSRRLIEETAAGARAALVFEPSAPPGALKSARKGTGMYTLSVEGRAAHAGLEPEKGVNALVALAPLILQVATLGDAKLQTTVTPTVAHAGTATNVVPAVASLEVDVRVWSAEEQARVDAEIKNLAAAMPGARLHVTGGPNRPPMEASQELVDLAERYAEAEGITLPPAVKVGGASDGNFTAAMGVPTLDGLGAVGEGAHAEGEYFVVSAMAERAALVAGVVEELLRG